jgi:ABC-type polar amino acid transport system ATPase subunit
MSAPVISVRNVEKRYGDRTVLRDVSFTVSQGEKICVIGSSGSGKSTLVRLLNRLERHEGGSITVLGQELCDRTNLRALRTHVAMVFQRFNLFPHMNVLANVALGPVKARGMTLAEANDLARAKLAEVGMSDFEKAVPNHLSGGQQQRVAIARALAMEPQLLLMDEPTSALDPQLVRSVLDVIERLTHSAMTIMIVTHELSFAKRASTRTIFLDDGCIAEDGASGQVLTAPKSPRLAEFLRHQD